MTIGFEGYQFLAWAWSEHAFGCILLGIRIYINLKGLRKVPFYRDMLLVFGMIVQTVTIAMDCVMVDRDYLNITKTLSQWENYPESVARGVLKMNWAGNLLTIVCISIIEVDLLLLYHDIAPRKHHPKLFRLILVGWVCVALYVISNITWHFAVCRPLDRVWDKWSACFSSASYYEIGWPLLALSEFAIYIIPIIIISRLGNWTFQQKLSAGWMFLVGFINILMIIGNFSISIYQRVSTSSLTINEWASMIAYNWFQNGITRLTGILVVCMPQLKQFYKFLREKFSKKDSEETHPETPSDGEDVPRQAAVGKEVPVNINVSTLGIPSMIITTTNGVESINAPQESVVSTLESASYR